MNERSCCRCRRLIGLSVNNNWCRIGAARAPSVSYRYHSPYYYYMYYVRSREA